MITKEFKEAVKQACDLGHVESVMNVMNLFEWYSNEAGINISDLREQILCIIAELEDYRPEPNDLNGVNLYF